MKHEILSTEHMEAMKSIADIGVQVAAARSELSSLQADKTEFLNLREKETHERVERVLNECVDALNSIGGMHAELVAYVNDVKSFAEAVKELHQKVLVDSAAMRERFTKADAALDEKRVALDEQIKKVEQTKKEIALDRKALQGDINFINEQTRLNALERETLEKAWKELETKKTTV